MERRKTFVLGTLAIFIGALSVLGISRAITVQTPLEIQAERFPRMGRNDAPVTMVVFEDFLCKTCRYFSLEIFPAIQSQFIDEGIVKYVMVPLAFSTYSKEIANAAYAVFYQAPGIYFRFVQELFSAIDREKKIELPDLLQLASQFSEIDLKSFEKSVKLGKYDEELQENLKIANKAMKKNLHTPAIFINGHLVHGISYESIADKIESIQEGG